MPKERLIYADDFLDLFYVASAGQDKAFVRAVEMVVDDTPAIDAVEVVRCKNCANWGRSPFVYSATMGWCKLHGHHRKHDYYCASAEGKA